MNDHALQQHIERTTKAIEKISETTQALKEMTSEMQAAFRMHESSELADREQGLIFRQDVKNSFNTLMKILLPLLFALVGAISGVNILKFFTPT